MITKEFYHNAINCANQFDAEHSNDIFVTTCPLFPYCQHFFPRGTAIPKSPYFCRITQVGPYR